MSKIKHSWLAFKDHEWMNEDLKTKLKVMSDSNRKYESEKILKEISGFEVFFLDFFEWNGIGV